MARAQKPLLNPSRPLVAGTVNSSRSFARIAFASRVHLHLTYDCIHRASFVLATRSTLRPGACGGQRPNGHGCRRDAPGASVRGQSGCVTRAAPFQVLVIPFRRSPDLRFCVLQRADSGHWQWIAGGGEDAETPLEAAQREVAEEVGLVSIQLRPLASRAFVPVDNFARGATGPLPSPRFPSTPSCLRRARTRARVPSTRTSLGSIYETAFELLRWDSNRSALWELQDRLLRADLASEDQGTT